MRMSQKESKLQSAALSVHVVLGAGQGLGAYSEMKSAKRRGERTRRLNCRHHRSGDAIQAASDCWRENAISSAILSRCNGLVFVHGGLLPVSA